jgi:replicative DNA helicase
MFIIAPELLYRTSIQPDYFFVGMHQTIYSTLQEMNQNNKQISPETLTSELKLVNKRKNFHIEEIAYISM